MSDENIKTLVKESFLAMLENSVGTRLFSSLLVRFDDSGEVRDVLNDGEYSCAFFVTGILAIWQAIDQPHATVATTMQKLEQRDDWQYVDSEDLQSGDVVIWEKQEFENGSQNKQSVLCGTAMRASQRAVRNSVWHSIISHSARLTRESQCAP